MLKYVLAISLLLLTACTGSQISTGQDIKLQFIDIPSGDLYEGDIFNVGVQITNRGTSPLQGQLCVRDSVSNYYEGIQESICSGVDIQGAEVYQEERESEIEELNLGPFSYTNLKPEETQTTTITAVFRYEIATTASTELCVKHPAVDSTDIPCVKDEKIKPKSQSETPLQVTSIEKTTRRIGQDEINVVMDITIEQTEDGSVISDITDPLKTEIPEVEYQVLYDNEQITCSNAPTGTIEWKKDRDKTLLHCQKQIVLQQEYLNAPLDVNLAYAFEKKISSGSINLYKDTIT